MAKQPIQALAFTIIIGVVVADSYGYASVYANLVFLALAAMLLVFVGLAGNAGADGWFQTAKTRRPVPQGRIWSMSMTVEGGQRGYGYSRDELARLLAEAFAVKSGESLKPDYDTTMAARERLSRMAGSDTKLRQVFDPHPSDFSPGFRFRRTKDSGYLDSLESAVALVQGEK
jgi:hypothetical protein